jgi:hypothetical protein
MRQKFFLICLVLTLTACAPAAVKNNTSAVVESTAIPSATNAPAAEVAPSAPTPPQVPAVAEVSFSKDIWPVLEKFASAAHGGTGGVFIENYQDVMKYIVPGNPEKSQLYNELTGNGYKQMPPGNPLPTATIQLFYDWIKQGAKNN